MLTKIIKKNNVWYFDDYFNYLDANKHHIPKEIIDFVLNPNKYLFNTQDSLHDALLCEVEYTSPLKRKQDTLYVKFEGSYKDRIFHFRFKNILSLKYNSCNKILLKEELLIHQFSIIKENIFRYEFIFSNHQKISIDFEKLSIKEELL